MEQILSTLFWAFCFWCVFKLGEHHAYYRVARGLVALKEQADAQTKELTEITKSTAKIEKIGEQYYAYLGDMFVAQGETVEKASDEMVKAIQQNPSKFIKALQEQHESK
jgi:hypothetical protein